MVNPYVPNPNATGITRIFRGANDMPFLRDDEKVFPPDDNWTLALAESIAILSERGDLENKKIVEMGCGSGVNVLGMVALSHMFQNSPSILGLDLTMEAIGICQELARLHPNEFRKVKFARSNLLQDVHPTDLEGTDIVIACLPQVVWDREKMARSPQAREFADYYEIDPKNPLKEDRVGFGLLARALDDVRNKTPKASVLFNVSGRQGAAVKDLFIEHGFPNITTIVERVIPHDMGTDLSSFIKAEQSGCAANFVFYKDEQGKHSINARQAQQELNNGAQVFHDLYAIHATPS